MNVPRWLNILELAACGAIGLGLAILVPELPWLVVLAIAVAIPVALERLWPNRMKPVPDQDPRAGEGS